MMKKLSCIVFFLGFLRGHSQQLPQYTQFIFNKAGYNPAAAGTSLGTPLEVIFGARTQYIGMRNNPNTFFLSGNYTFIPTHSYRNWHNVGAYFDQDRNGIFVDNSFYASYTFHQLLSKKTVLSFGLFAGLKQFSLNNSLLDRNDPVVAASARSLMVYPDIIPGIRLYNKKFFADFSLWQLTGFRQKGFFSSKQIGSPSKLPIHYVFSIGRKFKLPFENQLLVSLNTRGTFTRIPNLEINVMNYWYKRFSYGLSVRGRNFVCGIFQIRVINNLVIGLAYDLSTNRMLRAAPHTGEIMIGLSPVFGASDEKRQKSAVDDCSF